MKKEFEKFIPADDMFSSQVDAAYEKQYSIFRQNIADMRQIATAQGEGKHGVKSGYCSPQQMEDILDEIDHIWHGVRPYVVGAHSAQEQAGALFNALRLGFSTSCYTDNASLIPRFWHDMVHDVAAHYSPDTPPAKTAAPSFENVLRIGGSDPHTFFAAATAGMCAYSDLTIDGLSDIPTLTQYYAQRHDQVGEAGASMPYKLTWHRYCAARKIADPDFTIPEHETNDFRKKMEKFYVREFFTPLKEVIPEHTRPEIAWFIIEEFFAPFKKVMPQHLCPEMAWFIGAATEAIRIEDGVRYEQSLSGLDRILRRGKRADWPLPANDVAPAANAASVRQLATMVQNSRYDAPLRSNGEIRRDPAAVRRMKQMLREVFEYYPEMAHHVGDIVAAKEYFTDKYLSRQSRQPAGGRER